VSWLGQAQWAHRFPSWLLETQLLVRGDVQLASDALLSLEQIAVGGYRTVRGYRENLLVRDNAAILSAELRIPLITGSAGSVELAPFYDWGTAWNENATPLPKSIRSAGVGLRFRLSDRVRAYAYWAKSLRDVRDTGENIQEDGFHLGITLRAF
jgi:hemolysin activation/secretion protein